MIKSKLQPKLWRKVKLGEVVSINPSVPLKKGSSYPYLDMADVTPNQRDQVINRERKFKGSGARFQPGDTIFARITPCLENGKIARVRKIGKPAFGSTEFFVLRGKEDVTDSDFVYYLSLTRFVRKSAEQSMIGVSGRQRVELGAFKNIEVYIPEDLNKQKRIADILSVFDDKIELNNKISRTLEQMASTIFKEWFVENQKSNIIVQKTKVFWKLENQKLGEIKDIIDIISGFPFSSKLYSLSKDALGVVTIKNVQDGNFVRDFNSFIKKETLPDKFNHDCYLVDGDILLSLTGNVGRVCFVYGGEYLLNQRVAKLKPKNERDRAFCYFLFRQVSMQNQLINMAKGSAQPNLSPVETGEIELAIPSKEILDNFSNLADPIYQRLVKNANENQKLSSLRDLLLPKLMSGEVKA